MSIADAKSIGAMALFGEKYGDRVRVVSVGDWARELCGGTHVQRSGQLGLIKLLSESSIGAGVRRIEALVGVDAFSFLAREHLIINSITELIKGASKEELPERIAKLLSKVREMEKEFKQLKLAQALERVPSIIKQSEKVGTLSFVSAEIEGNLSPEDLRVLSLDIRERLDNSVVVLWSVDEGRVSLVCAVHKKAQDSGVKAGLLVKAASQILGGGGGGKDDFAQGGGVHPDKLSEAISALRQSLSQN